MATRTDCLKALDLHEEALSKLSNVVGMGIVEAEGKGMPPSLAVAVYVSRKVPLSELKAEQRIPRHLSIPGSGGQRDVAVRVLEQGSPSLEQGTGF